MTIRLIFENFEVSCRQIEATGSIRASASAMKINCRRAWLLFKAAEEIFGAPFFRTGGICGGGAKLTVLGKSVVAHYRQAESAANLASRSKVSALPRLAGKGAAPSSGKRPRKR